MPESPLPESPLPELTLPESADPITRAHLRDAQGFSPPIARFAPPQELGDLIRRYWLPVWSLPQGESSVQRVLQYPVCQLVVAPDYAHLVGPRVGLSTKELAGTGWAFGAMLQPAAGSLLLGGPVAALVGRDLDLDRVPGLDGADVGRRVRELLGDDPRDAAGQSASARVVEEALGALLPVDDEGRLVNDLVELVEHDPGVTRVADLGARLGLSERSLQRLTARRIGLSPKWLIQRRRLHDATGRLARPDRPPLTVVAAELGYADEAHFVRDFRRVTGLTPGAYAAEPRPAASATR